MTNGQAWLQLVMADGSDEWLTLCNAALVEVQMEQSRRNAMKIRKYAEPLFHFNELNEAADLIDPEFAEDA